MICKCPSILTDLNAIEFINQLRTQDNTAELIIDFSELQYVFPFATLLLAESIRDLIICREQNGLNTLSSIGSLAFNMSEAISYLMHFGFFQFVGLPYGKMPNEIPGNRNYIPIRILTERELTGKSARIQDAVQCESENIAGMIYDTDEKRMMLSYCFREIIRNVFEHAMIDYCTIMAQKWNYGNVAGDVEIAIVDKGKGIFDTMREAYELTSIEEAILESLKPGTSRVRQHQNQNEWDNTGFGLYIVSQLGRRYGNFTICSNGKLLNISTQSENFYNVAFNGTAIKLRINTRDAEYFPNIFRQIMQKGEETSYLRTDQRKRLSKSSKYIS
jgi:hypothetical protein